MALRIKFCGVRGSIACPSPEHMRYGGNTSCIEVVAGENRFVMDAGTGIRNLGRTY
ncbi:MAG: MBL fold metallo-hydrolase, partial [Pseudomonadota bacterium]